jgi:uncharacterized protein YecE (DUF72 family)
MTQLRLIEPDGDQDADEEIIDGLHRSATAKNPSNTKASPVGHAVRPQPVAPTPDLLALAAALPPHAHLGTSSWYFPGWAGLVWDKAYAESALSKSGLAAYSQHPLLRTVSIDSSFYRPIPAAKFAQYAAQVPTGFRFVVKAPALFCDALIRDREGHTRGAMRTAPNPQFLDAAVAQEAFVSQAMAGLGAKAGVLVFQLSPIPRNLLGPPADFIQRLSEFMRALPPAAGTLHAVELRNAELIAPGVLPLLVQALAEAGWHYCLALHDLMPPIAEQLKVLRAVWRLQGPQPLVCRWSLQRGLKYEQAKGQFEPFNQCVAPDPATRGVLARVIAATVKKGMPSFVTINNKAEGSAPLSVLALAGQVAALLHEQAGP